MKNKKKPSTFNLHLGCEGQKVKQEKANKTPKPVSNNRSDSEQQRGRAEDSSGEFFNQSQSNGVQLGFNRACEQSSFSG